MRAFAHFMLLFPIGTFLVACNVTTPKEVKVNQSNFSESMNLAIQQSLKDNWATTENYARSAGQSFPEHNLKNSEDGHYAYLSLQAQALEAFSYLAGGKIQEAKLKYRLLFEDVRLYEQYRERKFRERITSARMWEAFGFAMFAAASAYESGEPSSLDLISALVVASESLSRPVEGGVDAKLVSGAKLESDGVRLTILPTVGPFAQIGRLFTGSGRCTASLIGEALALTNAHCVTKRSGKMVEKGRWPLRGGHMYITFEGLYASDRVNVVDIVLHEDGFWNTEYAGDYRNDWAVLKLDRHPAGRGWFGIAHEQFEKRENIFIAGHSSDLNDGRFLTVDWNCDGLGTEDLVVHSCRGAPGLSGAPILVTSGPNKLHYLVGLHAFKNMKKAYGGGPATRRIGNALRKLAGQV